MGVLEALQTFGIILGAVSGVVVFAAILGFALETGEFLPFALIRSAHHSYIERKRRAIAHRRR